MKTNIITPTNSLHHLLHAFNAESLGEGNTMAGVNVLAAMCASIANVSTPGACLETADGNRLAVGMNFLAAGGLTRSLVDERALDPISFLQANLVDHLRTAASYDEAVIASKSADTRRRTLPPAPTETPEFSWLKEELQGRASPNNDSAFQSLLLPCRERGLETLTDSPCIFLETSDWKDLDRTLSTGHLNYPYVRASLVDSEPSSRLCRRLMELMRGKCSPGLLSVPTVLRGRVAASCSIAGLRQSVNDGEEGLLSNLLWLVDGGVAPYTVGVGLEDVARHSMPVCYEDALANAWRRRLDYRGVGLPTVRYEWEIRQREWVAFLTEHEPQCPGLTLAARPLFATLVYGLVRISPLSNDRIVHWSDPGVLGLAKMLVGRMVSCRQRLIQTEKDVACRDLAMKLVPKLVEGPLDARGLIRKTSRLLVAECREALDVLHREGLIRQVEGEKWELALPAPQAVEKLRLSYIDD